MRRIMGVVAVIVMVSVILLIIGMALAPSILDNAGSTTIITLSIVMFCGGIATGVFFGMESERRIMNMLTHMCTELKIKLPD